MNFKSLYILIFTLMLFSCKEETANLGDEQKKEANRNQVIFNNINNGWIFEIIPLETETQSRIIGWNEWRNFISEINRKPKETIGEFQKKASVFSKKVMDLYNNIPLEFDKPQIKTRIAVLETKVKSLDLFIHLNPIPDKKVVNLISEINTEIAFFQFQLEEIVEKSKIPMEEGESDIIRLKDTTRMVPDDLKELE